MQPATSHIRDFEIGDLDELFRLRKSLWDGVTADEHQNEILDILAKPETQQIFVVDRGNGGLAGFLEASIRPMVEDCESENVGYLEGWYVDEEVRRRGLGRQLVRKAEEWARRMGCVEMASDVELGNDTSLLAHKSLGYDETSRLIHLKKDL